MATKSKEEFFKNHKAKDNLTHECKACLKLRHLKYRNANLHTIKQSQKAWDKANPERIKGIQLRRHYWPSLSPQAAFANYMAIYNSQNGCCAICGKFEPSVIDGLHVDHNHSSNKVRGLLCGDCNVGLGCFKDNMSHIVNAVHYLNRHGSKQ